MSRSPRSFPIMMTALGAAMACLLAGSAARAGIVFTDVTAEAGIDFVHVNGATGRKYYVETMGSGACWLDYDGDGDIDLFVVNSAALPVSAALPADSAAPPSGTPRGKASDVLYRNEGKGRFKDVTDSAGLADSNYGMGCVAGDIDNDGDADLFVTNFGPDVLYRNDGGRFTDVTAAAGTGDGRWSASAAFADIDNDADLDLYVTNYIDFTLDNNKYCSERPGLRSYCHPDEYNGVPDALFRNKGNGLFEDVSATAGVADPVGKGLGVVFTDVNEDGWQDIYVANDKTINFLYLNRGNGTFEDRSVSSGAGFSDSGVPQAGMGTDAADVNGDGRMDLIVTNLDYETNELYLNNGDVTFNDATFAAGLGEPGYLHVGFGVDFLDYDNDGDKDMLIVNGHILDNVEQFRDQLTYAQPRSLLANDGKGRFREVGPSLGEAFVRPAVGRGLAVGDYDDDGDLDFIAVNCNSRAELFRNDGGNDPARGGGNWLMLRLEGTRSNRDGVGARVRVLTRGADGKERWQVDEVRAGSSYLSANDRRLHFGLGAATKADVVDIRWPSGTTQRIEGIEGNRLHKVKEPAH